MIVPPRLIVAFYISGTPIQTSQASHGKPNQLASANIFCLVANAAGSKQQALPPTPDLPRQCFRCRLRSFRLPPAAPARPLGTLCRGPCRDAKVLLANASEPLGR